MQLFVPILPIIASPLWWDGSSPTVANTGTKNKIIPFFLKVIFIILFIGFGPQRQEGVAQDFEVAPVRLNFAVEPGGIGTKTVTVRNHGNKKQAFILTMGDVMKDSLGQRKTLPAGTAKRSCANWITINPSLLELNPNEAGDVEVVMRVSALAA